MKKGSVSVMKYSLDSSAIIDIQRKNHNVLTNLENAIKEGNQIFICSIAYYEVVRGFYYTGATRKLKEFLQMYKTFNHLSLNMKSINKAIDIYNSLNRGKMIEDNDIYIAAVAMTNDCTLVTANDKHFSRIDDLNFVNWRI